MNDAFTEAGKWVDKTVTSTVNWILGTWDDVKNAIEKAAVDTYDAVVNFGLGIVSSVTDFIASIPKSINVVVNFVKGLVNGGVEAVTNDTGTFQGGEPSGLGWGETFDVPSVPGWDGFAKGSWNIARNNQKALLHKGEIVLNQSQARRYREGEGSSDRGVAYGVGRAVKEAFKETKVLMSGEKVGDLTTRRVQRNMNASNYAVQKAYGG